MHDDLAGLIVDAALKLDPHPAMALVGAAIAPGDYGVGENEERGIITAVLPQALHVEPKFVIEHGLKSAARNVSVSVSIDRVADLHVVSRHALGDCPRSAADTEKPANDFLPGADLGKRAVPTWIKIDPERLGMGIDRCLFHSVRTNVPTVPPVR